jgi:hypothetical protein
MHGHGFRVESSYRWRSGLHPGAGIPERPDHAVSVCADCALSGGGNFEPASPDAGFAYSVLAFTVIPSVLGSALRRWLIAKHGREWFEGQLLLRFAPVTITALLATLVLIFAFQADNIPTVTSTWL